ncbi:MAG: helix-turn-helix domain-containing protein, partial [Planctomycetota bacterium]
DSASLLILDIDELETSAQSELLGFLMLPDFPIRIIATAKQPVHRLLETGDLTEELTKYISTQMIELEPLLQRREDIPLLAQAFLEQSNRSRKKQLAGFSKSVLELFFEFDWPENLDQLKRIVENASEVATGSIVVVENLPDEFLQSINALRIGRNTEEKIQLDEFLAKVEQELIQRALIQAKGNKTKAAELLGISRAKLIRRVDSFQIRLDLDTGNLDSKIHDAVEFEELDS